MLPCKPRATPNHCLLLGHLLSLLTCYPVVVLCSEGQGPVFLLEPASRVDFSNSSGCRLECVARGEPTPTIQWMLGDGSPAERIASLRYSLANGSLVFPPFSAAQFRPDVHRATYRCLASNERGKIVSRDIRLRAVVMQDFSVSAASETVTRGNCALLKCVVPSFVRDFITVTSWLQDHSFNIYPSSDGDGKLHMLPSGELFVSKTTSSDSYSSYQCRVTHRLSGETRVSLTSARVTVSEPRRDSPPSFSERSASVEVRRDDLVVLPCLAQGNPPPEYQWEFGTVTLVQDEHRYAMGGLLIIPRAQISHSGRYLCVAFNAAGRAVLETSLQVSSPLSARISPTLVTATLGQPAELTCLLAGHPLPSVTWTRNGQPVSSHALNTGNTGNSGNNAQVLRLQAVTRDDQGMYQCFAKNENDMTQACAELCLGDTPPQLVYRFIHQTIQPGPSISLKCVASGNPTPNVKWALDGFSLPQIERFVIGQYVPTHGDVISHVNITDVHVADGGVYTCLASNRVGETSHSAHLNVYGAPEVRAMGDISAVAGEPLRVSCPVAGYPIDVVRWYRGERLLPMNRRHIIFPNGSLLIEKVQPGEDGGSYHCVAANKQGNSATATAQINVIVPPKITPFSFRGELGLGERVGVQCVVSTGDAPLSVRWLKDGAALATHAGLVERSLDQFTSVLSIASLTTEHAGNFTCIAENSAGRQAWSALLRVHVPPRWLVEPQDVAAKLGHQAILNCKVDGFPKPSISWKKAAADNRGESPGEYVALGYGTGAGPTELLANGSLRIQAVTQDDQGNYLCEASNGIGVGLSTVVRLNVQTPVHFKIHSRKELVRRGAAAILKCQAFGDLPINLTWRKEGSTIVLQSRASVKNSTVLGGFGGAGGVVSELHIGSVRSEDGGVYTCQARNQFGQDQTAMHLLVQDAPGSPSNLQVLQGTSRRLNVGWTPAQDGNSPVTRFTLRYSNMPVGVREVGPVGEAEETGEVREVGVPGNQHSALLEGLHPATRYVLSVLAENAVGSSPPSRKVTALTEEEAPSAPPQDIAVEPISSTQLSLSFLPPPLDQWNGPLLGHYLGNRELGESEGKREYNFTTVPLKGSVKEETRLDGLKKFCKYGLVVQAFNNRGAGPLSPEVIAQTLEDVPEASPREVRCFGKSADALELSWQPPPESQVHGLIQGYKLVFTPVQPPLHLLHSLTHGKATESQTKMTTALSTVLHGLARATNYSIQVLAFTRVGDGLPSSIVFCATQEDVPGPPGGIKAVLTSVDTALITWLPPREPNGIILKYGLYVRLLAASAATGATGAAGGTGATGGRQVDVRAIPHLSTSQLRYELPGLDNRLRYEFWVTAFTKVGEGQSTPIAALTPSPNVKAAIVSFGGVRTASWKEDVRLACLAVGVPAPSRRWSVGGQPLSDGPGPASEPGAGQGSRSRAAVSPDGSLLLSAVQRSDQGEYKCAVRNPHGSDVISVSLTVLVPPGRPLLLTTGNSVDSVLLQWKLGDDGGCPVRGLLVNYRLEHGEWEEVAVDGTSATHSLAGLRCGTMYHVFVTAVNAVGSGPPSATLQVRTRGALPLVPAADSLLVINSTTVGLRLADWPDGGCPMVYFVVEYAAIHSQQWALVGNNLEGKPLLEVVGLSAGTSYRLRVTAHNAAGFSVGSYHLTTLDSQGAAIQPSHVTTGSLLNTKMILLTSTSLIALTLIVLAVCLCIKRRCEDGTGSLSRPGLEEIDRSAASENKHNCARRDQLYATVRKLPASPKTLECIPEYSQDIRPYATFHVSSDATSLRTFAYHQQDISPTRKSLKSEYCRVKKWRVGSEMELESDGSESETEAGTWSRTESSNQLDDGISHQTSSRLKLSYPGHPLPETSPRLQPQRRYCQAHLLK